MDAPPNEQPTPSSEPCHDWQDRCRDYVLNLDPVDDSRRAILRIVNGKVKLEIGEVLI